VEASLTGKEGTALAKQIAALGKRGSLFGGTLAGNAALGVLLHVALPNDLRDTLGKGAEEAINKDLEKEKDPAKRAQLAELAKVVLPTLKAGELDVALSIHGPTASDHYGFLGGIKVKNGEALEQAARDGLKRLPEAEQAKIKLDAESAGEIKIHRIDTKGSLDEKGRKLLGDNPVYFAFRSDSVLAAAGEGALEILKQALAAKPEVAPILQAKASIVRLAPLLAMDAKLNGKEIAEKAFGEKGKNNDKLDLSVEGGKALKLRLVIDTQIAKFISVLDKEKKAKE